jgi:hypothetical protein
MPGCHRPESLTLQAIAPSRAATSSLTIWRDPACRRDPWRWRLFLRERRGSRRPCSSQVSRRRGTGSFHGSHGEESDVVGRRDLVASTSSAKIACFRRRRGMFQCSASTRSSRARPSSMGSALRSINPSVYSSTSDPGGSSAFAAGRLRGVAIANGRERAPSSARPRDAGRFRPE